MNTPTKSPSLTITAMRTVVLGGTGKTGSRVVERLRTAGAPVRAVGRSTAIPFDWADRSTWQAAVAGARAAYVAYSPDLAVPGSTDDIAELLGQLEGAGVEHVTLLSGRGEPEALDAERVVRGSGLSWSVVRASWFFQNFTESYLRQPILDGVLYLPAGDTAEPFIDADDIAEVAAATLLDERHAGRVYEVTGPELLTFGQVAEQLSVALGRPVTYVPVSYEEYARAARADGVPEEVVWLLDYLFRVVLDGRNESLTDGVQRALGRAPRLFGDFAAEHAAAGTWS
ncbi:NmrA family NAD(P)-binding protein [Lysobacter korlensis]|uniref:NmrA family NAD(P)-binding protein n=1 Tax=Lysobacter korlensis TaxID=553636 RepID=A0ABV6RW99_9GAMM